MSVNKRLGEMNARQYALNIFKAITRGDETFSGYNKPILKTTLAKATPI